MWHVHILVCYSARRRSVALTCATTRINLETSNFIHRKYPSKQIYGDNKESSELPAFGKGRSRKVAANGYRACGGEKEVQNLKTLWSMILVTGMHLCRYTNIRWIVHFKGLSFKVMSYISVEKYLVQRRFSNLNVCKNYLRILLSCWNADAESFVSENLHCAFPGNPTDTCAAGPWSILWRGSWSAPLHSPLLCTSTWLILPENYKVFSLIRHQVRQNDLWHKSINLG